MITLFAISKSKLLILTKNTVIFHNSCRSGTSNTFFANPPCETRLNMPPTRVKQWRARLETGWVPRVSWRPLQASFFLCSNVFFCKWSLFFCPFFVLNYALESIFSSISSTRWSTYAQRSKLTCEVERDSLTDNFPLSLLFRSFIRKSESLQFSIFRKVLPSKFIA